MVCALPAAASADPPACATAPDPYTGDDAVVAELRSLRVESQASCAALAARLDAVEADVKPLAQAVADASDRAHTDSAALGGKLDAVDAALGAVDTDVQALQPAADSTATADAVQAAADGAHADQERAQWALGLLGGLVVVSMVAPYVRRWWLP